MTTWRAAKAENAALSEATVREALERLDSLWEAVPCRAGSHHRAVGPADRPEAGRARATPLAPGARARGPAAWRHRQRPAERGLMAALDPSVVTIKVPFAVRKRGGRKLVLAPDGAPVPPLAPQVDGTLVKAIARAFRWQKMLEKGRYATIKEIAKGERINPSYVSRVLRLTLLAPATVEAILTGRTIADLSLAEAIQPFPSVWSAQRWQQ